MNSKFGKHYPVLSRSNERERLLFVAAAGLAFSLLIILVVVFNFKQEASSTEDMQAVAPPPAVLGTITLLTPERAVRQGSSMSNVLLKEVYWPRNQVPEGAVRDISEVQNMFARVNLTPGVPLQKEHLTHEHVELTLQPTPGNRAVTISVSAETSVENHAGPGSRVDVVLTHRHNRKLTSKVIVENARVISLGGTTKLGPRGRASGSTLTLDVAPSDALQIMTAKKMGTISLLMRHNDDLKPVKKGDYGAGEVVGGDTQGDANKRRACKKGTVRISGNDFVLACDGSMHRVDDPYEP